MMVALRKGAGVPRCRRIFGLGILVGVISILTACGLLGGGLHNSSEVPKYSSSWEKDVENCPPLGGVSSVCADVHTKAKDPDLLASIVRQLAKGDKRGAIVVEFYDEGEMGLPKARGFYYPRNESISGSSPRAEVDWVVSHAIIASSGEDVSSTRIHAYDHGWLYIFEGNVLF
jgi:hypothetical protein